jgi:anion transporter
MTTNSKMIEAENLAAAEEEEVSPRRAVIGLVVAFAILFFLHWGQPIPGLKPQAQTVLGIFAWFITVMVTDAMNKLAVGLTTPLLLVLLGGYKVPEGFKAFSSGVFFLGAGAFIFAGVMMGTPLGRRIAVGITTAMRSARATRIMGGLAGADLAVGGVLPTVTETALFLPVVKAVNLLMKGKEHLLETRRIQTALLYMDPGLVPLFTGPLVLTSHFPNIMLVGHLKTAEKIDISWIQWFWLSLPLWGLLPILFLYVCWWFKLWGLEIPGADRELPRMKQELGKITWPEIWGASCISLGLILWVTEGTVHKINTEMIAVMVVLLLFLPWGGIKYNMIAPHVLWDTLFLLGGAISLGDALSSSGAVKWMADGIVAPLKEANLSLIPLLFILIFGFHIARAGILSAVAMGAAFIPLTVGLAKSLDLSIMPFTLVVINSLSYAFLLPISITAFLIAWGATKASGWEVVKFGIPLTIISNIYVILVQTGWLALIGYPMR